MRVVYVQKKLTFMCELRLKEFEDFEKKIHKKIYRLNVSFFIWKIFV